MRIKPYKILQLVFYLLGVLLFSSCATFSTLTEQPALSAESSQKVEGSRLALLPTLQVPIQWSDPTKNADPVIPITINGLVGSFVLDTGASQPILFEDFVQRAGLKELLPNQVYPGSEKAISVKIGDFFPGKLEDFVVLPSNAEFIRSGWSGMISPQRLFPDGCVIIDFPNKTLIGFESLSLETLRSFLKGRYPGKAVVSIPWLGANYWAVLVPAEIGRRKVILDVDSGKSLTSIPLEYLDPRTELFAGPKVMDVNGHIRTVQVAKNQSIQLGALTLSGLTLLTEQRASQLPDGQAWQGGLGMDLLKDFVLVIPPRTEKVVWLIRN